MKKILFLLFILLTIVLVGCNQQSFTENQNEVNNENTSVIPKNDGDISLKDEENKQVTATVIINNGSCIISDNSYSDIKGTMCAVKAKYARDYDITVSGSMTGPEGTVFSIGTEPGVPGLGEEIFSCGGWEKYQLMHTCTRQANSSVETAQWSITRPEIMGEYINVNPNMQIIITTKLSDEVKTWESVANATYILSCPKVEYCTK